MITHRVTLNVLGYRSEDEYVALALDMDLCGHGKNFNEALEDLDDLVRMQISFALHKHNSLEMAYFPAEAVWFERFAEARQRALRSLAIEEHADFRVAGLPMPEPHIIEKMKEQFRNVEVL